MAGAGLCHAQLAFGSLKPPQYPLGFAVPSFTSCCDFHLAQLCPLRGSCSGTDPRARGSTPGDSGWLGGSWHGWGSRREPSKEWASLESWCQALGAGPEPQAQTSSGLSHCPPAPATPLPLWHWRSMGWLLFFSAPCPALRDQFFRGRWVTAPGELQAWARAAGLWASKYRASSQTPV